MATKRTILEHLTADELRGVVDQFDLEVEDRRSRGGMVDVIAASRKVELDPVLTGLSRERLKELCRKLELDDAGRDKARIVARLLGCEAADDDAGDAEPAEPTVESAAPATKPRRGRAAKASGNGTSNGGDLGFERTLWQAADKLRNNMDAAEYKHVVLGLIFPQEVGRPRQG
jgi:type I restriction enzyme M protein